MTTDEQQTKNDHIARAWGDSLRMLARLTGGEAHQGAAGVLVLRTGVPAPNLNGIFSLSGEAKPAELLNAVRGWTTAGPWSVTTRGEMPDDVMSEARGRGLAVHVSHPLLTRRVMADDTALDLADGVTVRAADPTGDPAYAETVARGFGAPLEMLERFGSAAVLGEPSIRGFVVEQDGVPVGAAMAVDRDKVTAVVNVAVPPNLRGRGYGTVATRAVARHASSVGSETLYLHATPMGLPLYERLGYTVVERWTMLVPPMG